ncbi:hypothetical protein [Chitinophaga sp. S165]|uniref:hypothetical protein n=1 Tax=Chitinophaga sp. S165 TaxID=2135462 RepID=UPI000D70B4C3|nr:hypothetical protein [Chitinophaga sp. S165]PWV55561.1 hypothetical protein C7475_10167 [Chitinophaga sp. S165]
MAYITESQKSKLNAVISEKGLALMINQYLLENGLPELEVRKLHLRPKRQNMDLKAAVPRCVHGKPMVEVCTMSGICKWECDH